MPDTDKRKLPEHDIRTKYIAPAILDACWDLHTQIREEETPVKEKDPGLEQKHKREHPKFKDN